tara:strand:+ start:24 stop:236 length:213 start_codon:yes stop_codon:yes gene_type:complete
MTNALANCGAETNYFGETASSKNNLPNFLKKNIKSFKFLEPKYKGVGNKIAFFMLLCIIRHLKPGTKKAL